MRSAQVPRVIRISVGRLSLPASTPSSRVGRHSRRPPSRRRRFRRSPDAVHSTRIRLLRAMPSRACTSATTQAIGRRCGPRARRDAAGMGTMGELRTRPTPAARRSRRAALECQYLDALVLRRLARHRRRCRAVQTSVDRVARITCLPASDWPKRCSNPERSRRASGCSKG